MSKTSETWASARTNVSYKKEKCMHLKNAALQYVFHRSASSRVFPPNPVISGSEVSYTQSNVKCYYSCFLPSSLLGYHEKNELKPSLKWKSLNQFRSIFHILFIRDSNSSLKCFNRVS